MDYTPSNIDKIMRLETIGRPNYNTRLPPRGLSWEEYDRKFDESNGGWRKVRRKILVHKKQKTI